MTQLRPVRAAADPERPVNSQLSRMLRLSKVAFMASICVWIALVAINNLTDYGANFEFVRHVFEMDTTFPGNPLRWRSVHSIPLYHTAYLCIIAIEVAAGLLAGIAVFKMLVARNDPERFATAKGIGVVALTLGVLLWLAGFEGIGGEYFLMWQSHVWNGQESAFRFAALCMLGLVFLAQRE
jgi:predicted small integral membrane protein